MSRSGLWCDVSDHSERPGQAHLFVSSKDCEHDGQTRTERDGFIAVISASDIIQLVRGDVTRPHRTSGGGKAHGRPCGCAEERREGGCPLLNLFYYVDFVSQQGYHAQECFKQKAALSPVRAIPGFRELHSSQKPSGDSGPRPEHAKLRAAPAEPAQDVALT